MKPSEKEKHINSCPETNCITDEIELLLQDNETLEDVLDSMACDTTIFEDALFGIVDGIIEQMIVPQGFFDLYAIGELLYKNIRQYVEDHITSRKISIITVNRKRFANSKETEEIKTIFQQMINNREASEQFFCDIGEYVEGSLVKFVQQGKWECALKGKDQIILDIAEWPEPIVENGDIKWIVEGERYYPIVWFGLLKEPIINSWTLKKHSIWDETDEIEQLSLLLEQRDDSFLTWYFYECGRGVPDIDLLLEQSPIKWDKEEQIQRKVNQYALKLYQKSKR